MEDPLYASIDDSRLAHHVVEVNGVKLHYVEAGEGPLVILLHGFPEFWYAWRKQILPLAKAGYRVVAPDMRGYNLSEKPTQVRAYGLRKLVDDVASLIGECGEKKAIVVGHDWGAGVAWAFAMQHPDHLERLAILNGPHPERMVKSLGTFSQLAKSWYMFFFQLPWIPEMMAQENQFAMLTAGFRNDPTTPDAFTEADIAEYIRAFSRPGALTATMNYYRAMFRPRTAVKLRKIDAPVMVIWGELDKYLGRSLAEPLPKWVPNLRFELIANASHWVQHEQPARVNELLINFFASKSTTN